MTVCLSVYQNHNPAGEPLGDPMRCSRRGEHSGIPGEGASRDFELHQARTRIGITRWPTSAAMPVLELRDARDDLKMLRETLCMAQAAIEFVSSERGALDRDPADLARLGRLIAEIDRQRPLGPDGKHGDLHTSSCGCDRG